MRRDNGTHLYACAAEAVEVRTAQAPEHPLHQVLVHGAQAITPSGSACPPITTKAKNRTAGASAVRSHALGLHAASVVRVGAVQSTAAGADFVGHTQGHLGLGGYGGRPGGGAAHIGSRRDWLALGASWPGQDGVVGVAIVGAGGPDDAFGPVSRGGRRARRLRLRHVAGGTEHASRRGAAGTRDPHAGAGPVRGADARAAARRAVGSGRRGALRRGPPGHTHHPRPGRRPWPPHGIASAGAGPVLQAWAEAGSSHGPSTPLAHAHGFNSRLHNNTAGGPPRAPSRGGPPFPFGWAAAGDTGLDRPALFGEPALHGGASFLFGSPAPLPTDTGRVAWLPLFLLVLGRAASGGACGGYTLLLPVYLGELAPAHVRGMLGSAMAAASAAGSTI
eukprot:scaffold24422_cov112-Isochrysis_galbana.AAC.10